MLAVHMGIEPAADFGVARATRLQDTGRLPAASVG
jgi:hypothetical protein